MKIRKTILSTPSGDSIAREPSREDVLALILTSYPMDSALYIEFNDSESYLDVSMKSTSIGVLVKCGSNFLTLEYAQFQREVSAALEIRARMLKGPV